MAETSRKNEQTAIRVSIVCIIVNIGLTAFKLIAGIISNSSAMLSDAVHSASDIGGTLIVIAGVKIAGRESDKDHQYGHERFECVAALILAGVLFAIGAGIGYTGIRKVLGADGAPEIPGLSALIAAVISVIIKEIMYRYTRAAAVKTDSTALMAEAWHHRSDALSSIGSFAGILGARMGFPVLDPLAAVIICVFILKAAYGIFMDAVDKMTDKACDSETAAEIMDEILKQSGVMGVDQLKTRIFGDKLYVDIEITADGNLSLNEAHEIAQRVHDAVESAFSRVKHCMVHVNPSKTKSTAAD